jgi:hypothetical protein
MASAECTNPVRGFISQRRYYFNLSFQFRITDIGHQAKIHQLCAASRQHYVPWLQTTVHNSLAVRHCKRFSDGNPNLQSFLQRQSALTKALRQSFSLEKFHQEITGAVLRSNVVELANVRMDQRRDGPRLAFHPLLQLRRRRKMRSENLDGYSSIEPDVPGAIYLAHPARAQGETVSHKDRGSYQTRGPWVGHLYGIGDSSPARSDLG